MLGRERKRDEVCGLAANDLRSFWLFKVIECVYFSEREGLVRERNRKSCMFAIEKEIMHDRLRLWLKKYIQQGRN